RTWINLCFFADAVLRVPPPYHSFQTATTVGSVGGWSRPEVSRELGNVVGTG
ncbi:hypothetical protein ALC57_17018, partial [Trachymyrmex cornetzi]